MRNLFAWLDAVAIQLNLQHSFVYDDSNNRVPGCYQHLSVDEETKFRRMLNRKSKAWGLQAVGARLSCGSMLEVGGGVGSGKGSLLMAAYAFGPPQGQ